MARNLEPRVPFGGPEKFDEATIRSPCGDQRAEQPFQNSRLHDAGSCLLSQGVNVSLDGGDIRLSGEVAVEVGDMLFGQRL